MRSSDTLVNNMLVTADLLNTINGGMSMPSHTLRKEDDHYELELVAPGVSAENLRIEIHNRFLSVFHYMSYVAPDHTMADQGAPNIIHLMPIPFDVELEGIRASYENNRLLIIMPFNEMAEGYHRSVEIDKN